MKYAFISIYFFGFIMGAIIMSVYNTKKLNNTIINSFAYGYKKGYNVEKTNGFYNYMPTINERSNVFFNRINFVDK